ncbi:MAG: threonine synthase [Calditrichaeota bacterium]|nr:threonine synthase [Calditrichota bacterium]
MTFFTHLECSRCHQTYASDQLINLCQCGAPLLVRYDLSQAKNLDKEKIRQLYSGIWDLAPLLPVKNEKFRLTLGEGNTPLLRAEKLAKILGLKNLYVKDESPNPTGSFKARGLCLAVSRAAELGVSALSIPTAGNAGGALAAYAALAEIEAHVAMPKDTPTAFVQECKFFGADVELVDGLITDCGAHLKKKGQGKGWCDVSTLKEPYRIEGKKTMGYELAFQFAWNLPDVIIYPTGGGTGLIGMWKAFAEMEALGWISGKKPKMVVAQSAGCAPMVRAFEENTEHAAEWENPHTFAMGLRVPKAIGDFLILRAVRESRGTAVAVSDDEILQSLKFAAEKEGLLFCPEGGAALAALKKLLAENWIKPDDRVVLFNTGTFYKYQSIVPTEI